jgi:hypothetical protein
MPWGNSCTQEGKVIEAQVSLQLRKDRGSQDTRSKLEQIL